MSDDESKLEASITGIPDLNIENEQEANGAFKVIKHVKKIKNTSDQSLDQSLDHWEKKLGDKFGCKDN